MSSSLTASAEWLSFYKSSNNSNKSAVCTEKSLNVVSLERTNPADASPSTSGFPPSSSSPYSLPNALSNFVNKAYAGGGGGGTAKNSSNSNTSSAGSGVGGLFNYGGVKSSANSDIENKIEEEESQSLIANYAKKSVHIAKSGLTVITGNAKTAMQNAQNSFNDSPASLSTQRILYFAVGAVVGCIFMSLAFMLFPTIIFAPSKFALLFTLGSLCWVGSLAALRGVNALLKHLIQWNRLPYSIAYVLSLCLTLYATLFEKSYILALLFSLIQIGALLSLLVSYIPGGTSALRFMAGSICRMAKGAARCPNFSSRETTLPI